MHILDGRLTKKLHSEDYNYIFSKVNGLMLRWGKTVNDDPDFSPFGPEIADIEITTSCKGPNGKLCNFCYKGNTPSGEYMSFETFEKLFSNLPKTLTQIAFGVDAQCESNPDVWKIMQYCRDNGVIPNVTVADITEETAKKLTGVCGAVAVSHIFGDNSTIKLRKLKH